MRYIAGLYIFFAFMAAACGAPEKPVYVITNTGDTVKRTPQNNIPPPAPDNTGHITHIVTGNITPPQLISFASSLMGVPYKYGSTNPSNGFDCSGFITYAFNHFGIAVPRTSVDFTYVEHDVDYRDAKPGDLILFTGTDSTIRIVGHMGIVSGNTGDGNVTFIHSTSGRANGVTETSLKPYYLGRYVKTIRIFPANDK